VTKSLVLSIWIPVIMGLVMSMILLERVIKVTIYPGKLRNVTEVEWHLSVLSMDNVVILSQRIQLFIEVRMHELVTPVVVGLTLMPVVLRQCRRVKVEDHF